MPVLVILQAFLLVLVSALNPAALVASGIYLAKERGARLENALLIGGLLMSIVVGIVVLVLVRITGPGVCPRAQRPAPTFVSVSVFSP